MKKFGKLILSALILASLATASWAQTAKISALTGKVEVQADGSEWKAAKVGDILKKGAVISTGFKSSCTINIDGSTVTLDPMTRITIEKLASNSTKSQTNLYLNNGKMGADVKKTAGKKVDFKVTSAASTASVRGTSFIFFANGKLVTTEGLVSKGPGRKAATIENNEDTGSTGEILEEDQPDDFVPADGESTVFTETTDVSKDKGVPVFAGQTSTTDSLTGARTSPQAEALRDRGANRTHGTESAADKEKITSIGNDSINTASDDIVESAKLGGMEIIIQLPHSPSQN